MYKNTEYLKNIKNFHIDEVMKSNQKKMLLVETVKMMMDAIVSQELDQKDQEIKKLIEDIKKTRFTEFSEIGYCTTKKPWSVQQDKQLMTDLIEAYKKLLEFCKKEAE